MIGIKILIFSDSHGFTQPMVDIADLERPGMILHLGDHDYDCADLREAYPDITIRAVRGNCDRFSREIENDEFVIGEKRVFMTHGNLYGVKLGLGNVLDAAVSRGAGILLFGHTHRPLNISERGIYVINPGSVGRDSKTYATLEIERGAVKAEIKQV